MTELSQLEKLTINCELSDAVHSICARLTIRRQRSLGMTRLDMNQTGSPRLTDAGLQNLSNLTRLERLEVEGGNFADAGWPVSAGSSTLRLLRLERSELSDAGFAELGKLTNLSRLYLRRLP